MEPHQDGNILGGNSSKVSGAAGTSPLVVAGLVLLLDREDILLFVGSR